MNKNPDSKSTINRREFFRRGSAAALLPLGPAVSWDARAGGAAAGKPRARDLGIEPGVFPPGTNNAITDVEGVLVGHTTIREGDNIRTGVTAVLPHGGNVFQEKVTGSVFVGNAFGKLAGSTQVCELGLI
jgi:D-aminopeptidase